MRRRKIFRFFDRYLGIPFVILLAVFTRRKRRLPIESIQNVLILKLAAIGDAILMVPTIRKIKNHFPNSKITFLCSDVNKVFVDEIIYVDKVINCHVYDFIKNPFYFIRFIRELRKVKYELVIDAGQWERINAAIVALLNKDYSVGFKTKGQAKHVIYDYVVEHVPDRHEVLNFLDLLVPLGIVPIAGEIEFDDSQLEFFITNEHRKFRDNFWRENKLSDRLVICLQPGCGFKGQPKQWDVENYISLGKMLKANYDDITFLITGAKGENTECNILFEALKDFSINICGKFSIQKDAAIIERAKLIICSNTGILHIATAVGTQSIALHGPHNHLKWGGFSKNAVVIRSDKFCSPCLYLGHDFGCKVPNCMKYISAETVYLAARKVLQPELFLSEGLIGEVS